MGVSKWNPAWRFPKFKYPLPPRDRTPAGSGGWEPYFYQGFLRFSVNRKISHEAQEAFPGLHNSQAGASGKHKESQRFQWDLSVVPRRALGASLGCCYALPALEAENHAFRKDFQGFP